MPLRVGADSDAEERPTLRIAHGALDLGSRSEREAQVGRRAGLGGFEIFFADRVAIRADFKDLLRGTHAFNHHDSAGIGLIVAIDLPPGKSDLRICDGTIVGRPFYAHAETTPLDQPQRHGPWGFVAADRNLLGFEPERLRSTARAPLAT